MPERALEKKRFKENRNTQTLQTHTLRLKTGEYYISR